MLHVGHDDVHRLPTTQRVKPRDAEQELATRHRLRDCILDLPGVVRVCRGDGLLIPGQLLGVESTSDLDCQIYVKEAVAIDLDRHSWPHRLSHGFDTRDAQFFGRGHNIVTFCEGREPVKWRGLEGHETVAVGDRGGGVFCKAFRCPSGRGAIDVGVDRKMVAEPPSEQDVDRRI